MDDKKEIEVCDGYGCNIREHCARYQLWETAYCVPTNILLIADSDTGRKCLYYIEIEEEDGII